MCGPKDDDYFIAITSFYGDCFHITKQKNKEGPFRKKRQEREGEREGERERRWEVGREGGHCPKKGGD